MKTVLSTISADQGYEEYRILLTKVFYNNTKGRVLLQTSFDNSFDSFLSKLPADNRQTYNCRACQRFINKIGSLAVINDKGQQVSALWSGHTAPEFFEGARDYLDCKVSNAKVVGVMYFDEMVQGTPQTEEWSHFYVNAHLEQMVKSNILTVNQFIAQKTEDYRTVMRAIIDYSSKTFETLVNILEVSNQSWAEKFLGHAKWLVMIDQLKTGRNNKFKVALMWNEIGKAPDGFCHIKASVIGNMLDLIENKSSLDFFNKTISNLVDPTKYMRPTAEPSINKVNLAEDLIKNLGLEQSLFRRFATMQDICYIWGYEPKKEDKPSSIFSGLKDKQAQKLVYSNKMPITFAKFYSTILKPGCQIDLVVPPRANFCALTTATHEDAAPIILWDNLSQRNPVSWYVYANLTMASQWNLHDNSYSKVLAITDMPNNWYSNNYQSLSQSKLFIIEGCKDLSNNSIALFPEVLTREVRSIRSSLEAYSKTQKLSVPEGQLACGIKIDDQCKLEVRVTYNNVSTNYVIDRLD